MFPFLVPIQSEFRVTKPRLLRHGLHSIPCVGQYPTFVALNITVQESTLLLYYFTTILIRMIHRSSKSTNSFPLHIFRKWTIYFLPYEENTNKIMLKKTPKMQYINAKCKPFLFEVQITPYFLTCPLSMVNTHQRFKSRNDSSCPLLYDSLLYFECWRSLHENTVRSTTMSHH